MLGPVQNQTQSAIVQAFYEDCHSKGYTFATGGEGAIKGGGYLFNPTIIDNPPDESRIVMEVPFGMIQSRQWPVEHVTFGH